MKISVINAKGGYLLACLAGMMFMLSACSSDDVQEVINQIIDDETITVSGVVTRGSAPEAGVI